MRIYDISVPVYSGMVHWPGDPPVSIEQVSRMDQGADANVSHLDMGAHTGTHVDAPVHFVAGMPGVDALDLHVLVGPALVAHLDDTVADITPEVLEAAGIPPGTERVLFRTRNSAYWAQAEQGFQTDFVAVRPEAAAWLVARGVRLVGVDYLSVAPFDASVPTHVALLEAGVIPVEGLNLTGIEAGVYQLVCLPMKLQGCDGAPARAILMRDA
ncbi:MAG TPA: cyclase family protein [Chloroflexia bacterium]|nr:cyclase family protein [Chloroflexia bacterium]